MQILFDQIPNKDKISGDKIVESCIKIGHSVISRLDVDTKDFKLKAQRLKKSPNPNYYCTILLSLITKEDEFSSSFDLTSQELKSLDSKLESNWTQIALNLKKELV
jgi:hypothetical protein